MSKLLVRYSVQNNQITLIRLITPIIKTLSVFFLKLMKYPPAPPNLSLICHNQSSQHQMKRCVKSFDSISIWLPLKITNLTLLYSWGKKNRNFGREGSSLVMRFGVMESLFIYWVEICPDVWSEFRGATDNQSCDWGGWDAERRYNHELWWVLILKLF